jgi:hypothetical protein
MNFTLMRHKILSFGSDFTLNLLKLALCTEDRTVLSILDHCCSKYLSGFSASAAKGDNEFYINETQNTQF